jgi:hypothetical protein
MAAIWDCIWDFKHFDRNNNLIWSDSQHNSIVDEGEEVTIEVLLRNRANVYIPTNSFWVGFYRGSIAESTTLLTVPNEPTGNGYSRKEVERSTVGWPTKEKDDGDWRVVSKDISFKAVGGDIGPLSGAFLCTSSDNTGRLFCAVASKLERTIASGETLTMNMKVKCK